MNTKRYSVDRITSGIITLIGDDDSKLTLNASEYDLEVNDIVDIEFSDGNIASLTKNDAEKEKRLNANRDLFNSLFKKRK